MSKEDYQSRKNAVDRLVHGLLFRNEESARFGQYCVRLDLADVLGCQASIAAKIFDFVKVLDVVLDYFLPLVFEAFSLGELTKGIALSVTPLHPIGRYGSSSRLNVSIAGWWNAVILSSALQIEEGENNYS